MGIRLYSCRLKKCKERIWQGYGWKDIGIKNRQTNKRNQGRSSKGHDNSSVEKRDRSLEKIADDTQTSLEQVQKIKEEEHL